MTAVTRSPAILAIETSGPMCSVALANGDGIHARRARVGNMHTRHILPMLSAVLDEAGVELGDCDAIAFGAGPGAFTGLRVACALAQGLAFGASLQVVPIGTLAALARGAMLAASSTPPVTVLAAQDARMGEVYWSVTRWHAGKLVEEMGPFVTKPGALRNWMHAQSASDLIGCGDAWEAYASDLGGLVKQVVGSGGPDAIHVARLGQQAWIDGKAIAPAQAAPLYVRDHVALTTVERMAGLTMQSAPRVLATNDADR